MLQKSTFEFLEALKLNNTREWFLENKSWYESSKKDVEGLIAKLIGTVSVFEPEVAHKEPKKCLFRIYRDTRFSTDKSPYKINFGAILGSKDSGYYLHISPEECFLACGYYMLPPNLIKKVRKGIYDDFDTLKEILEDKTFKKEIGDLCRDEDALQRVPNGFDKEHPAAEYMKLKRFYVMKSINRAQLMQGGFEEYAAKIFKLMQPLKNYLNDILND